ncbi:hypothetical protein EYF80_013475 [Liparis tanakae]|uniref:Uncharacterized protein n=1 Tax=Liparis tanakae TaxID=230148 RepID=A0A4Z2IE54_9TELE|nr:hypothetical protein EYF80_013475 [Liparis tanakae]
MVTGFSMNLRNSASHWAPTAPSTTRWSQLSVTDIMLATFPSLALAASAVTSLLMAASPLTWALKTMGVMRPLGVLTATLRSTTWFLETV